MLEIEDMEGENRLVHLILSNSIDFVVYRYLSSELLVLRVCASVFYHVCVCVCVCVYLLSSWCFRCVPLYSITCVCVCVCVCVSLLYGLVYTSALCSE